MGTKNDIPNSLFKDKGIETNDNFIQLDTDVFIGKLFTEDIEEYRSLGKHFDSKRISNVTKFLKTHSSHLNKDSNVLEIGAGLGNYTIAFLKSGSPFSTYFVNDLSQQMLLETQRIVNEEKLKKDNIFFLQADICQDIFVPNSFDLVFGSSILHHLVDYEQFLRSTYDILKPSGKFIVSEPFSDPYLIASIVLQLSIYIAVIQEDDYSKEEKDKLDSYCTNVIGRTNLLFTQEDIEGTDDKHLFQKSKFREISKEIGYSECVIGKKEPVKIVNQGHFETFIKGIFRGLKVEPKQNIDVMTNLFDSIYPDLITDVMPPQEYIILTK